MFASLLFLLEQHARERQLGYGHFDIFGVGVSRNVAIASVCFGLHVLSGIAYCYRFATQYSDARIGMILRSRTKEGAAVE